MDTLRTAYSKLKKSPPSGSAAKKLSGRKKWILANLSFLSPYIKHRDSISNIDDDDDDEEDEVMDQDQNETREEESHSEADNDAAENEQEKNSHEEPKEKPSENEDVDNDEPSAEVVVDPSENNAKNVSTFSKSMKKKKPPTSGKEPKSKKSKTEKKEADTHSLLFSLSTSLKELGHMLTKPVSKKHDKEDTPDNEVDFCIENLRQKLKSIKKRSSRLRLIDEIDRITAKYVIRDCEEEEKSQSQTMPAQYHILTVPYESSCNVGSIEVPPQVGLKDTPQMSSQMTSQVAHQMTSQLNQQLSPQVPQQLPQQVSQHMPQQVSQQLPQQAQHQVSQPLNQRLPQQVNQTVNQQEALDTSVSASSLSVANSPVNDLPFSTIDNDILAKSMEASEIQGDNIFENFQNFNKNI